MLGLGLDAWNNIMVASLAFGALAAVVVGVSTYVVIQLQKLEAQTAADQFERYKLATEQSISNANARAAEAQLALEQFKAPRSIADSAKADLIAALVKFSGTEAAVYVLGEGPEPFNLGREISNVLTLAHWSPNVWTWSGVSSGPGLDVFFKPGADPSVIAACEALAMALISAHVETSCAPWPTPDWDQFGGLLNGPDNPTKAPVRIVVGTKPQ